MSVKLTLSSESVNVEANALAVLANNGYLRIYDQTQPVTANTAVDVQTLLAELRFNTTAVGHMTQAAQTARATGEEAYLGLGHVAQVAQTMGGAGTVVAAAPAVVVRKPIYGDWFVIDAWKYLRPPPEIEPQPIVGIAAMAQAAPIMHGTATTVQIISGSASVASHRASLRVVALKDTKRRDERDILELIALLESAA